MEVILSVTEGPHRGRSFGFRDHDTFIVGRATYAHFRLPQKDQQFSRVHFMIEVNPPHCRLMDAGSTNGTFVNGRRVSTADLHDGDQIQGGNTVLRVSVQDPGAKDDGSIGDRANDCGSIIDGATIATQAQDRVNDDMAATVAAAARGKPLVVLAPPTRIDHALGVPSAARGPTADLLPATIDASPARVLPQELLPPDFLERIRGRPQPIAGYRIVGELGRGGMGVVYLALCDADDSVVALKTTIPDSAASETDCRRFLREAGILKQLAHPYIVSFRDMGQSGGQLFFAMDFVNGGDIGRMLRDRAAPLSIGRAVRLVCQLLEALHYAHAKGFVHRDIKPGNLLVAMDAGREIVRLADFGLSRTYQASPLSGLTMMGDKGGTVPFMAPEQITHFRDVQPPADQYSVAATLYTLLTAKMIYELQRETGRQLMQVLHEEPVPLDQRRRDLPPALVAAVHRGLARDPSRRFASAAEMRHALLPFCHLASGG